jgi:hypothetical protein
VHGSNLQKAVPAVNYICGMASSRATSGQSALF